MDDRRRLKFCLIRPPATESFRFTTTMVTPPLGLAYIGGALKKAGYPFTVIDTVAECDDPYEVPPGIPDRTTFWRDPQSNSGGCGRRRDHGGLHA